MPKFIIRQGDKVLARLEGEGIVFGTRSAPGGLHVTELVDDPSMLKVPNPEFPDRSLFVVAMAKGVTATKEE